MATVENIIDEVEDEIKQTITASSDGVTPAKCIRFLNRISDHIVNLCVTQRSELGKTTGSITTVDGTASYTTFATTMHTPDKWGYILKTDSKPLIKLISEHESTGYGFATTQEAEPEAFYVTGANAIVLCPTPDAVYTVAIPYWYKQTTLTAESDTIPFNGLFDDLYTRCLSMWVQNRDEYRQDFELNWRNEILGSVLAVLDARKKSFSLKVA